VREVGSDFTKTQYFDRDSRTHIAGFLKKYHRIEHESLKDHRFVRNYSILRGTGFVTLVVSASLLSTIFLGLDSFLESSFGIPVVSTGSAVGMFATIMMLVSLIGIALSCYLWVTVDRRMNGNVV
jgi:uncharacterized membrane protein